MVPESALWALKDRSSRPKNARRAAAVAVVKVAFDHQVPRRTFRLYKYIAVAAVIYCLWTVIGGDPNTVVNAMVALLISVFSVFMPVIFRFRSSGSAS